MTRPFEIAGVEVALGETRQIRLKISELYNAAPVNVPILVIRGARDGPRLFLTAAIHGDEINGTQIIRRLIFHRDWSDLRGTLVCIPIVNVFGFFNHSRYLPDRRDLNRSFPGRAGGSNAGRIAYKLFHEVVRKCDVGIDFHTAAVRRTNYPHIRADWSNPAVRRLARAFGCELILDRPGEPTTLRASACREGIPVIVYEAGETFRFQPSIVRRGVDGVLNVMAHLKMIDHAARPAPFEAVLRKTAWLRAARAGILAMKVRPGAVVAKGEVVAANTNPFGRERNTVRAPFDGFVLGATTWPSLNPGDAILHLGEVTGDLAALRRNLARLKSAARS
jgi:hypothetical protein